MSETVRLWPLFGLEACSDHSLIRDRCQTGTTSGVALEVIFPGIPWSCRKEKDSQSFFRSKGNNIRSAAQGFVGWLGNKTPLFLSASFSFLLHTFMDVCK